MDSSLLSITTLFLFIPILFFLNKYINNIDTDITTDRYYYR